MSEAESGRESASAGSGGSAKTGNAAANPGGFEEISLVTDDRGVARLTLDRPERHNVLSARMIDELAAAAALLGESDDVRVVVLTGAGPSFCAGGDLRWMREQMNADPPTRTREARKLAEMLRALDRIPKPVIGAIQGSAFGGGAGLVSICDVAVGVDTLQMGFTETRLGLIPATIAPYVLARMGQARARRVFMSSRRFGADEAVGLGLLARAVPPGELEGEVEREIEPYLACAPGAVAEAKRMALSFGEQVTEEVIDRTVAALVARWETDEARTRVAAFLEKRR